jgi:benzaldehyde dehydrogenase (NAD)
MSATTEVEAGAEVKSLLDQGQWTGKIYSDGWVDAPAQIETTEPATGEVLGTAGGGYPETIARAASSAASAQRAWAETPFADRVAVVQRAAS